MTSSGEQCFSGGIDSTIQWWNIPSSNVDPYDTYGTCWNNINHNAIVVTKTYKSISIINLTLLSLSHQIPVSWQGHGWGTQTPCGDWRTAASRTASCPARPTARWNCGTQQRKTPASALSTQTRVSPLGGQSAPQRRLQDVTARIRHLSLNVFVCLQSMGSPHRWTLMVVTQLTWWRPSTVEMWLCMTLRPPSKHWCWRAREIAVRKHRQTNRQLKEHVQAFPGLT